MKIISARSGQVLPAVAFTLGQNGRGRHLEEVRIDNRNPPQNDEVGYRQFGGQQGWEKGDLEYEHNPPHVILTSTNPAQRGILLVVRTEGTYTRGCSLERDKGVVLKGGDAKIITAGVWAWGDAGNIGRGRDELWHVQGPSVFCVYLAGGEGKGYGWRYVIVTKRFRVSMLKRDELCQLIATDADPDITEVVRKHAAALHEDVRSALQTADELEEDDGSKITSVAHFVGHDSLRDALATFGIAIPVIFKDGIGGVSGVESGVLMPGTKRLALVSVGPGGGKRYGYKIEAEVGITRLATQEGSKRTSEFCVGLIERDDWHVAWTEFRDGEVTCRVMTDAQGTHRYNENADRIYEDNKLLDTTPWPGHESSEGDWTKFCQIFGLNLTSPKMPVEQIAAPIEQPSTVATHDAPIANQALNAATPVAFTDEGKRWFRCGCGATQRMGGGDHATYLSGGSITLTCAGCNKTGTVKK